MAGLYYLTERFAAGGVKYKHGAAFVRWNANAPVPSISPWSRRTVCGQARPCCRWKEHLWVARAPQVTIISNFAS